MDHSATTDGTTTGGDAGGEAGALLLVFAQLSLLAVGGVSSVLPEMQRLVVDRHQWMSGSEFAALYALAQAAPGPNMLVSTVIGWRVAGLPGALMATLGMIGPSSVLTWVTTGAWHRFRDRPWRRVVQTGLVPVTCGLVMAGAAGLVLSTATGLLTAGITAGVTIGLIVTRLHPLAFLAAGALLGVAFGSG